MRRVFNVLDRWFLLILAADLICMSAVDSESPVPMILVSILTAVLVAYLLIRIPYQVKQERRAERGLRETLNKK